MPHLTLSASVLRNICSINHFSVPDSELILAGIRGCVPVSYQDQQFKASHQLAMADINYKNPRCTLVQWKPAENKLAVFPGSTVPHLSSILSAKAKGGIGANCLFTGFYTDYRKGHHKAGTKTGHEAFRQNAIQPIRRSSDDLDYDADDRVEYDNPHDNIHCGWFGSLNSEYYASAGCQVIMGYPKCLKPERSSNTGPWKQFHENAYQIAQRSFSYILVTGTDILNTSTPAGRRNAFGLRFGSSGPEVKRLQELLGEKKYYEGIADGEFGPRTMKAVIAFQKQRFGNEGADGIVGPITFQELEN